MLFKKYYLSMCMIARRIVEDEDVAKDLVQEIFIRLWEKRKTYDFQEMTDIFLYVSVRNKCFDYLRSRKKLPLQQELKAADNEYFFRDILIEEETYRIIMEAIDALPVQSGRVIKLSLEGKQNKEISENLGISVNTVKSLKYKAMDTLRAVLKDYFYLL
ncbi:MAG TPA: RNA polymerase sigma-70 factor, partial [Butyricimonas virosa]|nr:RNA polymerase sigma-70 factor [Butyricimonas virosa]